MLVLYKERTATDVVRDGADNGGVSRLMSIVPKRLEGSRCHLVRR